MKIASWNVNGVRSVAKKGMLKWLVEEAPDVLCLQETKAQQIDLDDLILSPFGYKSFWHSAKRKGYSGVAFYTKAEPLLVEHGLGDDEFDSEGRVIAADFGKFVLINAYFPNSQREGVRLSYKLAFCHSILKYCEKWRKKKKNVVICGDFNIAHKEIDLKNPKQNVMNAGFLPEERAWLDEFVEKGYVDVFREFSKDPGCYTWWSYRPGIRERNIGWRLDYHFVNKEFISEIQSCTILPKVLGSDHCPVILEIN